MEVPDRRDADGNDAGSAKAEQAKYWTTKERQLTALAAGRAFTGASIMLSMFASSELLRSVFQGNQPQTQRVLSLVNTGTTLLTFCVGPLNGALMDSIGRRPFLMFGSALAATLRLVISIRPSVKGYIAYRFALTLAMMPFFSAFRAAVADLVDRTTDEYTRTMGTIDTIATIVRMAALTISGSLTPRQSMLASAGASALAAGCFAFGTTETLKDENKREINWSKLRNPFSSVQTLSQSRGLSRLALLSVLIDVPDFNSTLQMYRSQRFGWGMREFSRLALGGQIVSLSSPVIMMGMLGQFGTRGTAIWSQRFAMLASFVNAFGSDFRVVALSPVLQSLRHGATAFDRVLALEAQRCGLGEGEKESLIANLSTLCGVVFPNVFSEIYAATAKTRPNTVFLLCALLHLLNSELVIPNLWPSTEASEGHNS